MFGVGRCAGTGWDLIGGRRAGLVAGQQRLLLWGVGRIGNEWVVGEEGNNEPGNPPSIFRSQRTCLVASGGTSCLAISALSCGLGRGVVEVESGGW